MFDRIGFVFGEAMIALRRNGFITFAAITTIAVSLFLVGGATYVYLRAVEYADTLPGKFEMTVFLKDGTGMAEITRTAREIRAIKGVREVSWIPRDKVWAKWRRERPEATEGIDNPFPDAYKVTISDLHLGDSVAESINRLAAVQGRDGVKYLKAEQRFVDQTIRIMKWLGVAVGGLLLVTAGVLIFNAIRLAILNRKVEIRIMLLVGASPVTVYLPFLIEGLVQGALGGAFSALLLLLAQEEFRQQLLTMTTGVNMQPFPTGLAVATLGLAGAMYGLFCSALALRFRSEFR